MRTASVVSPGPLAPGWVWPVASTAEEWLEGGEKCICLPSSHFMRLLWAIILFLFQDFFFFFMMRTIFKAFIEFVTVLLLFYVLAFGP